ncbi:rpa-associated protein [Halopelagius fulvigenes]|uniref:Rpa-associated protein n=1 Tax=Halopelagius fulvigenes TaxID=1198324 RepID=A0ABD5TYT6_9EURY
MSVVENRREVAHRMFAAEFDDASFSYSEGDEERAPNYVVTPTGARVNRLFAVGVLTEIENVNEEVLRGRVVDPSGAFVTYAGQYQPEAMAFLDQASPPAFVSLTGKARTYEPEDSDRVFTSVRPESINDVDADTRDRWVVSAAEATLERVATFAEALEMDERGDDLRRALEARGVESTLATGIPMAIEHYGTTEHYLEAVRRLAVEALELVSGDVDSVGPLDVAPGDDGPNTLGPLPDIDIGEYSPVETAAEATTPDEEATSAEGAASDEEPEPDADDVTATDPTTDDVTPDEGTVESTVEDTEGLAGEDAVSADDVATADESAADVRTADEGTETDETAADSTDADSLPSDVDETQSVSSANRNAERSGDVDADEVSPTDPTAGDGPESTPEPVPDAGDAGDETEDTTERTPEPAGDAASVLESDDAPADPEPVPSESDSTDDLGDFGADEPAAETEPETEATDDLGDFGDDASPTGESDELASNGTDADSATTDEMYEMDEEERRQVEEEFGTEFSTGAEVDSPGEADIDVPDVDEVSESGPASGGVDAEEATNESESVETAEPDADEAEAAETDSDADEAEEEADLEDVDLEDAAVEVMSDLDDGDGADREEVVAAVVDRYGADPGDVEDAIEDALMGGKCYEPAEGTLKSI